MNGLTRKFESLGILLQLLVRCIVGLIWNLSFEPSKWSISRQTASSFSVNITCFIRNELLQTFLIRICKRLHLMRLLNPFRWLFFNKWKWNFIILHIAAFGFFLFIPRRYTNNKQCTRHFKNKIESSIIIIPKNVDGTNQQKLTKRKTDRSFKIIWCDVNVSNIRG